MSCRWAVRSSFAEAQLQKHEFSRVPDLRAVEGGVTTREGPPERNHPPQLGGVKYEWPKRGGRSSVLMTAHTRLKQPPRSTDAVIDAAAIGICRCEASTPTHGGAPRAARRV